MNNVRGVDDYKRRLEIEEDGFQILSPELACYVFWCGLLVCWILFR